MCGVQPTHLSLPGSGGGNAAMSQHRHRASLDTWRQIKVPHGCLAVAWDVLSQGPPLSPPRQSLLISSSAAQNTREEEEEEEEEGGEVDEEGMLKDGDL